MEFPAICYVLALILEIVRLCRKPEAWVRTGQVLLGLGLLAQSVFLASQIFDSGRIPLSSPQDALFVLVWILIGIAMGSSSVRRKKISGLYLLLTAVILLGIGIFAADATPFAAEPASKVWAGIHGISMLCAAVSIFFGFFSGIMYLRQTWNLKHPRITSVQKNRFPLPSLEWLHTLNQHSLKFATGMLALGVLSGIVMDTLKKDPAYFLADWMILGTMGLLFWFIFSLLMGFLWKRANAGPQIAFRTILNFIALCTLFGLVIFSQHRSIPAEIPTPPEDTRPKEILPEEIPAILSSPQKENAPELPVLQEKGDQNIPEPEDPEEETEVRS